MWVIWGSIGCSSFMKPLDVGHLPRPASTSRGITSVACTIQRQKLARIIHIC
jgi:hypothetical protein